MRCVHSFILMGGWAEKGRERNRNRNTERSAERNRNREIELENDPKSFQNIWFDFFFKDRFFVTWDTK